MVTVDRLIPVARRTTLTTRMTLLVVVICVLVLTLAYPLRLYVQQQNQIDKLSAKTADQLRRVEVLKTKVAGYDDPEWARDEARSRLHYTQPGEKVYLAPATPSASPSPGRGVTATGAPWFSRLWSGVVGAGQPTVSVTPAAPAR